MENFMDGELQNQPTNVAPITNDSHQRKKIITIIIAVVLCGMGLGLGAATVRKEADKGKVEPTPTLDVTPTLSMDPNVTTTPQITPSTIEPTASATANWTKYEKELNETERIAFYHPADWTVELDPSFPSDWLVFNVQKNEYQINFSYIPYGPELCDYNDEYSNFPPDTVTIKEMPSEFVQINGEHALFRRSLLQNPEAGKISYELCRLTDFAGGSYGPYYAEHIPGLVLINIPSSNPNPEYLAVIDQIIATIE